jgi:hypothetical protein
VSESSPAPSLEEALEKAKANPRLNALEDFLAMFPPQEMPLIHRFTPGLYIREIHIPAGTVSTTKIHKKEHPFVISKGEVSVWTEDGGVQKMVAPFTGITTPGTRRIIFAHTDVVWVTFHTTDKTDLKEIESEVIEPHDIPTQITVEDFSKLP